MSEEAVRGWNLGGEQTKSGLRTKCSWVVFRRASMVGCDDGCLVLDEVFQCTFFNVFSGIICIHLLVVMSANTNSWYCIAC